MCQVQNWRRRKNQAIREIRRKDAYSLIAESRARYALERPPEDQPSLDTDESLLSVGHHMLVEKVRGVYPGKNLLWPWVLCRTRVFQPKFVPYNYSLLYKLAAKLRGTSKGRLNFQELVQFNALADCLRYLVICSSEFPVLVPVGLVASLLEMPEEVAQNALLLLYENVRWTLRFEKQDAQKAAYLAQLSRDYMQFLGMNHPHGAYGLQSAAAIQHQQTRQWYLARLKQTIQTLQYKVGHLYSEVKEDIVTMLQQHGLAEFKKRPVKKQH